MMRRVVVGWIGADGREGSAAVVVAAQVLVAAILLDYYSGIVVVNCQRVREIR